MRYRLFVVMGGFAALATTVGLHAHHSVTGQYDPKAAVTVEGIVVEVRIRNPHSQMRMEVVNAAKRTEVWALEMDDVADMAEQGITAKTLRAGDKLVIFGFPARDGLCTKAASSLRRPEVRGRLTNVPAGIMRRPDARRAKITTAVLWLVSGPFDDPQRT